MSIYPARATLAFKFSVVMLIIMPLFACQSIPGSFLQQGCKGAPEEMAQLEQCAFGRLGVYALNTQSGEVFQYRADERFPLASTFKVIAAAGLLDKSEDEPGLLHKRVRYSQKDLGSWSPVTSKYLEKGMTYSQIAAAAVEYSDNTAGNLLLKELGGPSGVTAYARRLGDRTFNLTRWEPDLNIVSPGEQRDTTTPKAMAMTLQKLALGSGLPKQQQQQLIEWLSDSKTGKTSIVAGLPKGWRVADKTGGGGYGSTNDVALIYPPRGKPWVMAVYFTQPQKDAPLRHDVLASAAKIIWQQWSTESTRS